MAKPTKKALLLKALRAARATNTKLSNTQLAQVCGYRYAARLQDLENDGHRYDKVQTKPGLWFYWLTFDAERDSPQVALDLTEAAHTQPKES
jgi:hypothetical protein